MERAQANAAVLAERLAHHGDVTRVRYPGLPSDPWHERATGQMTGFGAMLAFEVTGGAAAAHAAAQRRSDAATQRRSDAATQLIVHATSLGGIETTMERRAKYAVEVGTPPGLLRISVGCEDVDDLWDDLVHVRRLLHPKEHWRDRPGSCRTPHA